MGLSVKRRLELVGDEIEQAYDNGETLRSLGSFHHCSPGSIRNLLLSRGVKLRSKGRKRKKNNIIVPLGLGESNGESIF